MATRYAKREREGFPRLSAARGWSVYATAIWLTIIFLLGGGSRHDIQSLVVLRPLALVVIAVGLWFSCRQTYRDIRWPLGLLLALSAIMIAQLIPLPPELWSSLPGRQLIYELSVSVGLGELWRPLTLSPMKTANSLASLAVPLSVLLLYALLPVSRRNVIWPIFVALGVLSALIGVAQVTLDQASLYFYDVTNPGSAVGFFANRNHNAVFLACATLISLYLAAVNLESHSTPRVLVFSAASLVLAAAVLTNGSRAGFLCLLLVWIIALAATAAGFPSIRRKGVQERRQRNILLGLLLVSGLVFAALFILAGRSEAVARLMSTDVAELRAETLPVLISMVQRFQPFGVGFGAFDPAYRMVEPVDLLGPAYLNNAHHDWLQLAIEGGVPAILVLVVGLLAAIGRTASLTIGSTAVATGPKREAWLGCAILLILAAASLVDYPLRVPAIMSLAIVALAKFAASGLGTQSSAKSSA